MRTTSDSSGDCAATTGTIGSLVPGEAPIFWVRGDNFVRRKRKGEIEGGRLNSSTPPYLSYILFSYPIAVLLVRSLFPNTIQFGSIWRASCIPFDPPTTGGPPRNTKPPQFSHSAVRAREAESASMFPTCGLVMRRTKKEGGNGLETGNKKGQRSSHIRTRGVEPKLPLSIPWINQINQPMNFPTI
ncbi:hypothetical protein B0H14DRAFT_3585382 [Mycena olivaceomarginata]|nr:hypothetical protein B0H14DRAFT_3585382 [Mycena olivaceomarginata]